MNLITSEEQFYAGVTPANLHERLEQVEEPLKLRIMGDLQRNGFLPSSSFRALDFYAMAAAMGDIISMVEIYCVFSLDHYREHITPENPLAWTIYMCFRQRNLGHVNRLRDLAKTEIRALFYYHCLLVNSGDYSELIRKRYIPSFVILASRGCEGAIVMGSLYGQEFCRYLHLKSLKGVMSWTNLSFFALSEPRHHRFICKRLGSNDLTNVEIYIYGQENFRKHGEVYANICQHLQQWINTFSCSLLRLQTFPKDVRLLLSQYAWEKRFEHLESLKRVSE